MDNDKIVLGLIALVTALVGGALFSIKKSKNKKQRNSQSNITILGDENKVVGGDDNSQ